jgi:excinuclease UvrABC helicase subunit UvrB
VVEQIIRPTGLLDPITYVYPKSGEYHQLISSLDTVMKKKPYLSEFLHEVPKGEDEKELLKDLFGEEE